MTRSYIETVAGFVAASDTLDIRAARPAVTTAFLDTAACIVAGRQHAATPVALAYARGRVSGPAVAPVLLGEGRLPAAAAAFVDSVAAHAWDFDDAALGGHPSAVLVPLVLSESTRLGRSGEALVAAYATGYQVWWDLHRRFRSSLHALGWHPTALFGTIAGVATLGSLRGSTEAVIASGLGLAASLSGGVVANFGTMTKPLQVGLAAQRAFDALDLAEAGALSSRTAVTGEGGLLRALDQSGETDVSSEPELSRLVLDTRGPTVKKYPICFASHRVVDGVHDLLASGEFVVGDVVGVTARISEDTAAVLETGQNGPAGLTQFDLRFAIATVLLRGRIGLREVQDEASQDPGIRALMSRIELQTVASRSAAEPGFARADRVWISTRDGAIHDSGEIEVVRGGPASPLSAADLDSKITGCIEFGEPDAARRADVILGVQRALLEGNI